ncbi:family 78 glycoside hydrolase catalytic domain [Lactobacillus sp. ESL0785]|uniref:alpha-L-rhamnosidase n=1 Tax=Lactobacillus sp. ESL0785 TaxID=2983232 RepID=UPI0023F6F6BF|nr:alpha-L-rhamnosidase [Lactobacillus sp. ESL0785]WEV70487.1 family 78 glycoside hydrolase catalytic domain [Lactobacillus sp. ESL0785]
MQILEISINHMHEPIGFDFGNSIRIEFSAEVENKVDSVQKRLIIKTDSPIFDSSWQSYDNNVFDETIPLKPRTRYTVTVQLKQADKISEGSTFFETGKMSEIFKGKWIGNSNSNLQNTLLRKHFKIEKPIKSTRLYITGLGLYEAYLNGKKIGNEFLAPGVTAYDKLIQVQTYDIDNLVTNNLQQELLISLGDGWYKGNFGFDGGKDNIYGSRQMALAELHINYQDGTSDVILSNHSWQTTAGKITKSAIYYGEDYDDRIAITNWQPAVEIDHSFAPLHDRLSLPIKSHEFLPVKKIIHTPKGETVLDFGQNHAGWPEFLNHEPTGTTVKLQMGEILQNGNFYRDNLREARASFVYTSDGKEKWVRPHFTYYGYRYVKVTGLTKPISAADFRSNVMYSDMKITGGIITNNSKVNRLFQNVLWGQKSNFMDVPTDCPQRDERLGWSGDADVFSETAVLNMNSYAFFKKYAKDMLIEQNEHHGMLTMYAPAMGANDGGAAVWGDAATIIPWTAYLSTGDPAILRQNYSGMKAWVDWINAHSSTSNLWTGQFQFGDWLSLDGENPALPTGKTDEDFIASVYYYYSTLIVSKTAKILKLKTDEADKYLAKAKKIKEAIRKEYITLNGRLAIDTQTAYALALYFNLVPEDQKKRVVTDLITRLDKDNNHLKTGFVGTPIICQVLSDNGYHKLATQIFLNEDFPSWLYAVNLGATTVWERWNSVLPDGSMNPEGMNSLNHYSIGAIMQWAYKYVLGLREQTNGYQNVLLSPQFDYRLKHVIGFYESSYGQLKVDYQLETDENHTVKMRLEVPFGQTVNLKLPNYQEGSIKVNGLKKNDELTLTNGIFNITFIPQNSYIEYYTLNMPVKLLMSDSELLTQLTPINSVFLFLKDKTNLDNLGSMSLKQLDTMLPFINISDTDFSKIEQILNQTPLPEERKFLHERRSL